MLNVLVASTWASGAMRKIARVGMEDKIYKNKLQPESTKWQAIYIYLPFRGKPLFDYGYWEIYDFRSNPLITYTPCHDPTEGVTDHNFCNTLF